MATNYKIKLKRFNGTDYDTLNLLSSNIIMETGNTLQSDVIPSTNGIIKNNNGSFQVATLGSDYTSINDNSSTSSTQTWSIDKIKNNASMALYFTSVPILATTGDIATLNNSNITENHVIADIIWDNPSYISSDVTWTTSNGSLVLNGTCISATTANIVLVKKIN